MSQANSHWRIVQAGKDNVISNDARGLWTAACDYFKHCDDNPITMKKTLTSGKEAGKIVITEHPRLYTIKGLCLHCNITEEYLRDVRSSKDKNDEYFIVISKILYIVWVQNVEFAAVGALNPIFISKLLNMDKQEEIAPDKIRIEIVDGLPKLSQSEAEILESIEAEGKNYDLSKNDF